MQTRSGMTIAGRGGVVGTRNSNRRPTNTQTSTQTNTQARARGRKRRRGGPGRGKHSWPTAERAAPAVSADKDNSIHDSIQVAQPGDLLPSPINGSTPLPPPLPLPPHELQAEPALIAPIHNDSGPHISQSITPATTSSASPTHGLADDLNLLLVQSSQNEENSEPEKLPENILVSADDAGLGQNNTRSLSVVPHEGQSTENVYQMNIEPEEADATLRDGELVEIQSSQDTMSGGEDTEVELATTATTPAPPEMIEDKYVAQATGSLVQTGRRLTKQKLPSTAIPNQIAPTRRSTRTRRQVGLVATPIQDDILTAPITTRKQKDSLKIADEEVVSKKRAFSEDKAEESSEEEISLAEAKLRAKKDVEAQEKLRISEEESGNPLDIASAFKAPESTFELHLSSATELRCPLCSKTGGEIFGNGTDDGFEEHVIMCSGAKPFGLLSRCPWCLEANSREVAFPTQPHRDMITTAVIHYGEEHGIEFSAEKPFAAVYFEALMTSSLGGVIHDPLDLIDFNRGWARDLARVSINSPFVPEKFRIINRKLANAALSTDVSLKPHTFDPDLISLYNDYEEMFTSYFKARPLHFELHGTSASNAIPAIYPHLYNYLPKSKLRNFLNKEDGSCPTLTVGYAKGSFGGGFGASAASSYLLQSEGSKQQVVPSGVPLVFYYKDRKTLEAQVQQAIEQHNCCGIVVEMMNNQGELLSIQEWKSLAAVCKLFKILLIVDDCILTIRCGYPFSWHLKDYSAIAKPDLVLFGKGLLVAGLALVPNSRVFSKVGSAIIDVIVGKWRSKVTCMLCPQMCLTASILLHTAKEQEWDKRAQRVGEYIATILDRFKEQLGFNYTQFGACFFLDKRFHSLPFVTAPAGEITRLFPSVSLNEFELGKVFDLEARGLMMKALTVERPPLCCFSCGDAGEEVEGKYIKRCYICGWYNCRTCVEKAKLKITIGGVEDSHLCVLK